MFFTRSLRRKLVLVLVLVTVMLSTLSVAGIVGLFSFRNMVNDLDFSLNRAPRRSDLAVVMRQLYLDPGVPKEAVNYQPEEFRRRIEQAEAAVLEVRRKFDALPTIPGTIVPKLSADVVLRQVDFRLGRLRELLPQLEQPRLQPETVEQIMAEAAHLQALAQDIPDPTQGFIERLRHARKVYRTLLVTITIASGIVALLFVSMLICGYRWVFRPIHRLHQGVRRVAQGDFDYRVEVATNDEMSELARSFNEMTARFQEIAEHLDQQVRERSNQLIRSERLAAVGVLAAGVAHEINNPLSAISMAAESLDSRTDEFLENPDPDEGAIIREYLGMIREESQRCREITGRLLDFARGDDTGRSEQNLTDIIQKAVRMMGHLSEYRDREIVFERSQPCHVVVNGAEIKQVVLNLVANGLESTSPGGKLEIVLVERTDRIDLVFRDNGCGMTPEVQEHLFEPFFTRRASGKGTGLGLAITHRIVRDHGGTINVESDGPGQGSTFLIHLPRNCEQAAAA